MATAQDDNEPFTPGPLLPPTPSPSPGGLLPAPKATPTIAPTPTPTPSRVQKAVTPKEPPAPKVLTDKEVLTSLDAITKDLSSAYGQSKYTDGTPTPLAAFGPILDKIRKDNIGKAKDRTALSQVGGQISKSVSPYVRSVHRVLDEDYRAGAYGLYLKGAENPDFEKDAAKYGIAPADAKAARTAYKAYQDDKKAFDERVAPLQGLAKSMYQLATPKFSADTQLTDLENKIVTWKLAVQRSSPVSAAIGAVAEKLAGEEFYVSPTFKPDETVELAGNIIAPTAEIAGALLTGGGSAAVSAGSRLPMAVQRVGAALGAGVSLPARVASSIGEAAAVLATTKLRNKAAQAAVTKLAGQAAAAPTGIKLLTAAVGPAGAARTAARQALATELPKAFGSGVGYGLYLQAAPRVSTLPGMEGAVPLQAQTGFAPVPGTEPAVAPTIGGAARQPLPTWGDILSGSFHGGVASALGALVPMFAGPAKSALATRLQEGGTELVSSAYEAAKSYLTGDSYDWREAVAGVAAGITLARQQADGAQPAANVPTPEQASNWADAEMSGLVDVLNDIEGRGVVSAPDAPEKPLRLISPDIAREVLDTRNALVSQKQVFDNFFNDPNTPDEAKAAAQDAYKKITDRLSTIDQRLSRMNIDLEGSVMAGKKPEAPTEEAPAAPPPPAALEGTPRYQTFELGFKSDVDKALYLLGSKSSTKETKAELMSWLTQTTGESETNIREYAAAVRSYIASQARRQKNKQGRIDVTPVWQAPTPTAPEAPADSDILGARLAQERAAAGTGQVLIPDVALLRKRRGQITRLRRGMKGLSPEASEQAMADLIREDGNENASPEDLQATYKLSASDVAALAQLGIGSTAARAPEGVGEAPAFNMPLVTQMALDRLAANDQAGFDQIREQVAQDAPDQLDAFLQAVSAADTGEAAAVPAFDMAAATQTAADLIAANDQAAFDQFLDQMEAVATPDQMRELMDAVGAAVAAAPEGQPAPTGEAPAATPEEQAAPAPETPPAPTAEDYREAVTQAILANDNAAISRIAQDAVKAGVSLHDLGQIMRDAAAQRGAPEAAPETTAQTPYERMQDRTTRVVARLLESSLAVDMSDKDALRLLLDQIADPAVRQRMRPLIERALADVRTEQQLAKTNPKLSRLADLSRPSNETLLDLLPRPLDSDAYEGHARAGVSNDLRNRINDLKQALRLLDPKLADLIPAYDPNDEASWLRAVEKISTDKRGRPHIEINWWYRRNASKDTKALIAGLNRVIKQPNRKDIAAAVLGVVDRFARSEKIRIFGQEDRDQKILELRRLRYLPDADLEAIVSAGNPDLIQQRLDKAREQVAEGNSAIFDAAYLRREQERAAEAQANARVAKRVLDYRKFLRDLEGPTTEDVTVSGIELPEPGELPPGTEMVEGATELEVPAVEMMPSRAPVPGAWWQEKMAARAAAAEMQRAARDNAYNNASVPVEFGGRAFPPAFYARWKGTSNPEKSELEVGTRTADDNVGMLYVSMLPKDNGLHTWRYATRDGVERGNMTPDEYKKLSDDLWEGGAQDPSQAEYVEAMKQRRLDDMARAASNDPQVKDALRRMRATLAKYLPGLALGAGLGYAALTGGFDAAAAPLALGSVGASFGDWSTREGRSKIIMQGTADAKQFYSDVMLVARYAGQLVKTSESTVWSPAPDFPQRQQGFKRWRQVFTGMLPVVPGANREMFSGKELKGIYDDTDVDNLDLMSRSSGQDVFGFPSPDLPPSRAPYQRAASGIAELFPHPDALPEPTRVATKPNPEGEAFAAFREQDAADRVNLIKNIKSAATEREKAIKARETKIHDSMADAVDALAARAARGLNKRVQQLVNNANLTAVSESAADLKMLTQSAPPDVLANDLGISPSDARQLTALVDMHYPTGAMPIGRRASKVFIENLMYDMLRSPDLSTLFLDLGLVSRDQLSELQRMESDTLITAIEKDKARENYDTAKRARDLAKDDTTRGVYRRTVDPSARMMPPGAERLYHMTEVPGLLRMASTGAMGMLGSRTTGGYGHTGKAFNVGFVQKDISNLGRAGLVSTTRNRELTAPGLEKRNVRITLNRRALAQDYPITAYEYYSGVDKFSTPRLRKPLRALAKVARFFNDGQLGALKLDDLKRAIDDARENEFRQIMRGAPASTPRARKTQLDYTNPELRKQYEPEFNRRNRDQDIEKRATIQFIWDNFLHNSGVPKGDYFINARDALSGPVDSYDTNYVDNFLSMAVSPLVSTVGLSYDGLGDAAAAVGFGPDFKDTISRIILSHLKNVQKDQLRWEFSDKPRYALGRVGTAAYRRKQRAPKLREPEVPGATPAEARDLRARREAEDVIQGPVTNWLKYVEAIDMPEYVYTDLRTRYKVAHEAVMRAAPTITAVMANAKGMKQEAVNYERDLKQLGELYLVLTHPRLRVSPDRATMFRLPAVAATAGTGVGTMLAAPAEAAEAAANPATTSVVDAVAGVPLLASAALGYASLPLVTAGLAGLNNSAAMQAVASTLRQVTPKPAAPMVSPVSQVMTPAATAAARAQQQATKSWAARGAEAAVTKVANVAKPIQDARTQIDKAVTVLGEAAVGGAAKAFAAALGKKFQGGVDVATQRSLTGDAVATALESAAKGTIEVGQKLLDAFKAEEQQGLRIPDALKDFVGKLDRQIADGEAAALEIEGYLASKYDKTTRDMLEEIIDAGGNLPASFANDPVLAAFVASLPTMAQDLQRLGVLSPVQASKMDRLMVRTVPFAEGGFAGAARALSALVTGKPASPKQQLFWFAGGNRQAMPFQRRSPGDKLVGEELLKPWRVITNDPNQSTVEISDGTTTKTVSKVFDPATGEVELANYLRYDPKTKTWSNPWRVTSAVNPKTGEPIPDKFGMVQAVRDWSPSELRGYGIARDISTAAFKTMSYWNKLTARGDLYKFIAQSPVQNGQEIAVSPTAFTSEQELQGGVGMWTPPLGKEYGALEGYRVRTDVMEFIKNVNQEGSRLQILEAMMREYKRTRTTFSLSYATTNWLGNHGLLLLNGGSGADIPEAMRILLERGDTFNQLVRLGAYEGTTTQEMIRERQRAGTTFPSLTEAAVGALGSVADRATLELIKQLNTSLKGKPQTPENIMAGLRDIARAVNPTVFNKFVDDLYRTALGVGVMRKGGTIDGAATRMREDMYNVIRPTSGTGRGLALVFPWGSWPIWAATNVPRIALQNWQGAMLNSVLAAAAAAVLEAAVFGEEDEEEKQARREAERAASYTPTRALSFLPERLNLTRDIALRLGSSDPAEVFNQTADVIRRFTETGDLAEATGFLQGLRNLPVRPSGPLVGMALLIAGRNPLRPDKAAPTTADEYANLALDAAFPNQSTLLRGLYNRNLMQQQAETGEDVAGLEQAIGPTSQIMRAFGPFSVRNLSRDAVNQLSALRRIDRRVNDSLAEAKRKLTSTESRERYTEEQYNQESNRLEDLRIRLYAPILKKLEAINKYQSMQSSPTPVR